MLSYSIQKDTLNNIMRNYIKKFNIGNLCFALNFVTLHPLFRQKNYCQPYSSNNASNFESRGNDARIPYTQAGASGQ